LVDPELGEAPCIARLDAAGEPRADAMDRGE
jgi:hypothetical protein